MWAGENQTPWGIPVRGGRLSGGPGGAPGGPPGPRGCTFSRVFNNSPSRDKMDFRFFRFFRHLGQNPPPMVHHTPLVYPPWDPPRPPQNTPLRIGRNSISGPRKPPKIAKIGGPRGAPGGRLEPVPGAPPGGPRAPGPRARARGAPGGPGGPPGGPPGGAPGPPSRGGFSPLRLGERLYPE